MRTEASTEKAPVVAPATHGLHRFAAKATPRRAMQNLKPPYQWKASDHHIYFAGQAMPWVSSLRLELDRLARDLWSIALNRPGADLLLSAFQFYDRRSKASVATLPGSLQLNSGRRSTVDCVPILS